MNKTASIIILVILVVLGVYVGYSFALKSDIVKNAIKINSGNESFDLAIGQQLIFTNVVVGEFLDNGFVAEAVANGKKYDDLKFVYIDKTQFMIQFAGMERKEVSGLDHFKRYATCDNQLMCNTPRSITVTGTVISDNEVRAEDIVMTAI